MDDITYTLEQIARVLGVSDRTILRRVQDGKLPATKTAGAWRVTAEDLRLWLPLEGYDIAKTMRELAAVAATKGTGDEHPAYIMGRVYGILVHLGAESLEHLTVAVVAPGRTFGYLLGKAHRRPGYEAVHGELTTLIAKLSPADISDRPWDMDRQGRFWLGFYAQQALDMEPDDASSTAPGIDDGETAQEEAHHDHD